MSCDSGFSRLWPCCMAERIPFCKAAIQQFNISSESAWSMWLLRKITKSRKKLSFNLKFFFSINAFIDNLGCFNFFYNIARENFNTYLDIQIFEILVWHYLTERENQQTFFLYLTLDLTYFKYGKKRVLLFIGNPVLSRRLTYFDGDSTSKQKRLSPSCTGFTVQSLKSSSITVTFSSPVLFLK